MKKKILAAVLASSLVLSGCGQNLHTANREYQTVGLFNQEYKHPNVCYAISVGNVIWSIILIESVFAPVYFVGFSIWNPVREKVDEKDTCQL